MRYRVFPAPRVNFLLDGSELPVRPDIGFPTQSILFIGLPEVAAPISLEPMPLGVQIIAAPSRGDIAWRVAYAPGALGCCVGAKARRPMRWISICRMCSPK